MVKPQSNVKIINDKKSHKAQKLSDDDIYSMKIRYFWWNENQIAKENTEKCSINQQ